MISEWQNAIVTHRRQIIAKLTASNPVRYAAVIQRCKREIKAILEVRE